MNGLIKSEVHPLIRYIREWEAFNAYPRKSTYKLLGKLAIGCMAFNVLLHLIVTY